MAHVASAQSQSQFIPLVPCNRGEICSIDATYVGESVGRHFVDFPGFSGRLSVVRCERKYSMEMRQRVCNEAYLSLR